jgi:membrane protein YqaA with SNARE-associated domain
MKKLDNIIIILLSSTIILWSIGYLISGLQSPLLAVYDWLLNIALLIGYPGTFIMSLLGNATIIFPFPYLVVPFALGGLTDGASSYLFDPWIVGFLSGLGATLGEMTGYYVGYIGGMTVEEKTRNGYREYIEQHPERTPFVIWFLAVTPIPDDPVIIPLGIARYSWWRVFLPCFLGKSMFLIGVSWAGRLGLEWVNALLVSSNPFQSGLVELLSVVFVILVIYAILRKDWSVQSS